MISTPVSRALLRIALTLSVLALVSCGGEQKSLSLLDSAPAAEEEDAERRRLEQLQLVRMLDANGNERLVTPVQLDSGMARKCRAFMPISYPAGTGSGCWSYWGGAADMGLCAARLLQSVAQIRAEPLQVDSFDDVGTTIPGPFTIPAQRVETRAAILRHALSIAKTAVAAGAEALGVCNFATDTSAAYPLTVSRGQYIAQRTVEAFNFLDEIAEDFAETTIAAADAQRSSARSFERGTAQALAGQQLSRAEVAHELVGGDPGLNGSTQKAFCSTPELSGRARGALAILRKAALNPTTVKDPNIAIDRLLNESLAVLASGSVKERLKLLDGVPIPGSTQAYTGLSTEDFIQARSYLAQEVDAFARSTTKEVPVTVPNGATVPAGVKWYAGTRNEPGAPPAEYFATLAKYAADSGKTNNSVSAVRARALTVIRTLLATAPTTVTDEQWRVVAGPLQSLVSQAPNRIVSARWHVALPLTLFYAENGRAADKLRLVTGLEGLTCATAGAIDGVRCTDSELTSLTWLQLTTESGTTVASSKSGLPATPWLLFLVKPRDPAVEKPGAFELVTGINTGILRPSSFTAITVPVDARMDKLAGEILRPSERYCARSSVECDGTLFDERMPLENELSEDGDGVESSWKRYLALARQAADEAHALGAEYIATGLEVDRAQQAADFLKDENRARYTSRVEGELETLQNVCGTALDAKDLLAKLGGDLSQVLPNKTCSAAADCCHGMATCNYTCNATTSRCEPRACQSDAQCCDSQPCPMQCVAGTCAATPITLLETQGFSEAASRLRECLGQDSVRDYVTLGDAPVCVWEDVGNPSQVCAGADEYFVCPVQPLTIQNGTLLTCDGLRLPANKVWRPVAKTLNVMTGGAVRYPEDPCESLRQLRHDYTIFHRLPDELYEQVSSAGLFSEDSMTRAANIGYRAFVSNSGTEGNRAGITVNNNVRWSTSAQSAGKWPCALHPYTSLCSAANAPQVKTPDALFCARVTCNGTTAADEQAITRLNQRMLEATMVLQSLTYGHYQNIHAPKQIIGGLGGLTVLQDTDIGRYIEQKLPANILRYYDDTTDAGSLLFWRYDTPNGQGGWTPGPTFNIPAGSTSDWLVVSPLEPARYPGIGEGTGAIWRDGFLNGGPYGEHGLLYKQKHGLSTYAKPLPVHNGANLWSDFKLTKTNIWDAVELMCEVTRGDPWQFTASSCPAFPSMANDESDFSAFKVAANCQLNALRRDIGAMVLARVPHRVYEHLGQFAVEGGFPAVGGEYGAQVQRLHAALTRYGDVASAIGELSANLSDILEQMEIHLKKVGVRKDQEAVQLGIANAKVIESQIRMDKLEYQQQMVWVLQAGSCNRGLFGGFVNSFVNENPSYFMNSMVSCYDGEARAEYESKVLKYEQRIASVEASIAAKEVDLVELGHVYSSLESARELIGLRSALRAQLKNSSDLVREAQSSLSEINASLGEIENLQKKAQRALARALQYDSVQSQVTEKIERALNGRLAVAKNRYRQSHKNAIRLAFLAKRSIEQRLGMHLSELRADLPLVEAPASWESQLCAASGVDYAALREEDDAEAAKNFADPYVGDYVRKLENLVESYRLEYDFQEGTDEAVVSLRDDVLNVRAPCDKFMGNLLYHSTALDRITANSLDEKGWEIRGCTPDASGVINGTCLRVAKSSQVPFTQDLGVVTGSPGFEAIWGAPAGPVYLAQRVLVNAGIHRLSWYSQTEPPTLANAATVAGSATVDVVLQNKDSTEIPSVPSLQSLTKTGGWPRHYRLVDIPADQEISVVLKRGAAPGTGRQRTVAGVMLERLGTGEAADNPIILPPATFVATGESLSSNIAACQDTTGQVFREAAWRRKCASLCADGFSDNCAGDLAKRRCFWEATVGFDQRDIESGRIFGQSGYARGNFNYRIESVGLNFVGPSVRDCSDSALPSACYGAGFVPYSIKHLGPLYVRNHLGTDFLVKLFTGNIEHARGLALERYLTNPLSSTDRELLSPYVRSELQGRPVDGSFQIRIWEEPGVDFNAIQDVQLYLKYRYWTRFD